MIDSDRLVSYNSRSDRCSSCKADRIAGLDQAFHIIFISFLQSLLTQGLFFFFLEGEVYLTINNDIYFTVSLQCPSSVIVSVMIHNVCVFVFFEVCLAFFCHIHLKRVTKKRKKKKETEMVVTESLYICS